MIDYSKYKRFYSSGGEFMLSGADFIGYVEIINGIPCEDITRKILTPQQTFATDAKLSRYFYDRVAEDDVTMPYQLEDVVFSNNDFLSYNLLKSKLSKLYDNNTYLFTRLFIPNNNIPYTDNVSFLAARQYNDTRLSNLTGFDGNVAFDSTINFKDLGNIKNFVVQRNRDSEEIFSIFAITNTEFITLTSDRNTAEIIEISNNIESSENSLTFASLENIAINDTHVYISDSTNNVVYKYEIAGYFNGDYALANKRNFIELIGGMGSVSDPSRFKKPKQIACNNEYVVVHDSGNYICKVYDRSFNFIRQIRGIALKVEELAAIEFNNNTNNLYIITITNTRQLKVYVYDSDFVLKDSTILNESLEEDETVTNITFSYNDSNIWYLCTSNYVYKKLVNRPNVRVGRFQTQNLFANNINTYNAPQKEWDNYTFSTTTALTTLNTTQTFSTLSSLSASSLISSVTSLSTNTYTTTLTSLSSITLTNSISTLSSTTLYNLTTSYFGGTPPNNQGIITPLTPTFILTGSSSQTITSIVTSTPFNVLLSSSQNNTLNTTLTSTSAITITVPITSAIQGTPININVEILSAISIPSTNITKSEIPNVDYYTVEARIPINNFWNMTPVKFGAAKFYWNVITFKTLETKVPVSKPYQYYRFIMYNDSSLTKVLGSGGIPGSRANFRSYGLYSIKLDIGWQPAYKTFTGWNWTKQSPKQQQPNAIALGINSTPSFNIPTFIVQGPSFLKNQNILNYTVRGNFCNVTQNNTYLYPPTQLFVNNADTLINNPYAKNAWVPGVSGNDATIENAFVEIDLTKSISLSGVRILAKTPLDLSSPQTPPYVKIQGSNNGVTFYTIGSAALPTIKNNTGRYINADLYEEAEITNITTSTTTSSVLVSSLSTITVNSAITSLSTNTSYILLTSFFPSVSTNTNINSNISSIVTLTTSYSANTNNSVIVYKTIITDLTAFNFDTSIDYLSTTSVQTVSSLVDYTTTGTVIADISSFNFTLTSQGLSSSYSSFLNTTYDIIINNNIATFGGVVDDIFRACRAVKSKNKNNDDIVLFSSGRIYFISESSTYASVLNTTNLQNFGIRNFSLSQEEYIQASTLNKELYKVICDIFTLKNNIIGRFSGFYNKDVFTLSPKAYNYNVNFFNITDQEFVDDYLTTIDFKKYFVNENEKSIVGVINRAIENIYKLQVDLFNITKIDRGSEIIPAFNNIGTVLLD